MTMRLLSKSVSLLVIIVDVAVPISFSSIMVLVDKSYLYILAFTVLAS